MQALLGIRCSYSGLLGASFKNAALFTHLPNLTICRRPGRAGPTVLIRRGSSDDFAAVVCVKRPKRTRMFPAGPEYWLSIAHLPNLTIHQGRDLHTLQNCPFANIGHQRRAQGISNLCSPPLVYTYHTINRCNGFILILEDGRRFNFI
jgi:hypothetical protein